MTVFMLREVERLKKTILTLSAMVEEHVNLSVKAVTKRDPEVARRVIEGDKEIDRMEIEVEEECLKILALHQPVAVDLRFIVAVLKINNDLERVGDLGVNISKCAVALSRMPPVQMPPNLSPMVTMVTEMVKQSLDALVNLDVEEAGKVCTTDDKVDALHRGMFQSVKDTLRSRPDEIDASVQYLTISRCLERIGDHATNISEDIVYMIEGEIIRHHAADT